MEEIIEYIKQKYDPAVLIVYGSYADGSDNENSDFDAMIIVDNPPREHDSSVVKGVRFDLFIHGFGEFEHGIKCEDYPQLYDCIVLMDRDGFGERMKAEVINYIENFPKKTREENTFLMSWCEKTLLRAKRGDAEGYFRWHWLLTDSLELYFDLCGKFYFGPKKSIAKMRNFDPYGTALYEKALSAMDYSALENWIKYLRGKFDEQ